MATTWMKEAASSDGLSGRSVRRERRKRRTALLVAMALAPVASLVGAVPVVEAAPTQAGGDELTINAVGGDAPDGSDGLLLAFNLGEGPLSEGQDLIYGFDRNPINSGQFGPMISIGDTLVGPAGPAVAAASWDAISIDNLSGSASVDPESTLAGSGGATIHYEVTVGGLLYELDRTISYTAPEDHFTDSYEVTIPLGNVDVVRLYNGGSVWDANSVAEQTLSPERHVQVRSLSFGLEMGLTEVAGQTPFDGGWAGVLSAEATIQGGDDLGFVIDNNGDQKAVYAQWTLGADAGVQSRVMEQFVTPSANVAPVWVDTSVAAGLAGIAYSDALAASGAPAPTYAVVEGSLPDGLSLDPVSGAITGTPVAGGSYWMLVAAANPWGQITHEVDLRVDAAPIWVDDQISTLAPAGQMYSDGVYANGNPAPTYSIVAGALPTGLSLNPQSGELSGIPTVAGAFNFTVRADNGFGDPITVALELELLDADSSPSWAHLSSPPFYLYAGQPFDFTLVPTGYPRPTLSLGVGSLPDGVVFDDITGQLSGTPTTLGPVSFEVIASNGIGEDAVLVVQAMVDNVRGCRDYSGESFVGSVLLNSDGTPIGCGTTEAQGAPTDLVPAGWADTFDDDFGAGNGYPFYTERLGYACDDCWIGIDGEDGDVGLPIGFPVDFYGETFEDVFVNSNGSISFGEGSDEYDDPLDEILDGASGVVAYGVDLDNGEIDNTDSLWGSGRHGDFFYWGRTTVDGHDAFVATWMNMQSYNADVDKFDWNTFQIVLVDIDDAAGDDVDIIINYGGLQNHDEGYDCEDLDPELDIAERCRVATGLGTVVEGVATFASLQDDDGLLYNGSWVADVADDGSTPLNQAHLNNLVAGRFLFEMRDGTLDETATLPSGMDTPSAVGGDGEVEINGSAPADNGGSPITGYIIRWREVGEMNWQEMDVSEFPATVTGLTNGTEYEFQTAAVNGVGVADFSDSTEAAPAGAPVWVDQELGAMQVGVTFTDGVFASGEPAPTYTVTAGTLPEGLSLNSTTGAITGTPTVAGSFSFTITASSGFGEPVSADFSGTVAAAAVTTTTMPPTTTTTIPPVPEMGFVGIDPVRLLDTRESGVRFEAGTTHELVVAGAHGVAADAAAVVLNLTATESLRRGFMTVYPCGQPRPLASNINFATGETIANAVTSAVGTDRSVCIYTSADTHVIVDIGGAYSVSTNGGRISALNPSRLYDSRDGGADRLPARSVRRIVVAGRGGVAADASSVVLNVTVVDGSAEGFATVYPCGESIPLVSNVNFLAGDVVANSVTSAVGDGGAVCVFISQSAHLVVDATSMYGPTGNSGGLRYTDIVRVMDTRELTGPTSGAKVAAGRVQRVDIAGRHGLGADLSAVTISVAVDQPESAGFITVFPCGGAVPLASNVNFGAGQTRAGAVTVQLGEGGALCIYTHSTTHLVVDVDAVFGISPT